MGKRAKRRGSVSTIAMAALLGLAPPLATAESGPAARGTYLQSNPPVRTASARALDGTVFRSTTYKKGGELRGEDVLTFKDGRFVSENCVRVGFGATPYWIRSEKGAIHFQAEALSPEHGTMLWKGIVEGDTISGSYLWTKERWYWTIRREVLFKGVRVK